MKEPEGKPYEGPSGIGRDSLWLTNEDLIEGKDIKVKIENVILYGEVEFQAGRKRKNYLGLKFVGKDRVLGVNATARKLLNRMFGNIVRSWKGQEITLYVSETQMAGETVKCIRIRDRGARAATVAEELSGGEDKEPQASGASEANGASTTHGDAYEGDAPAARA